MSKKRSPAGAFFAIILLFLILFFGVYCATEAKWLAEPPAVPALTATGQIQLQKTLDEAFPERKSTALSPLPYAIETKALDIAAGSAIIIDTATGSIIYEKNADAPIPPASLTKIVEMYVIFEAIERGEAALDDVVPLPPQSWSENLPSDASRMYLGRGQRVTLRELLLGLAIASGNDASIACAYYITDSMEAFVERMNAACAELGLTHTHFVESSGYSEKNVTTAREFATFARHYLAKYPQSLNLFHAQKELVYPRAKNLPAAESYLGDSKAIRQKNTNKLLGRLKGCDGLKTGFIDESGYNIAVTAQQNGTRFLAVTMNGPGSNTAEGNEYRIKDNMELFNYAFGNFADYKKKLDESHSYVIGIAGAKEKSVTLVPAYDETFTVPFIAADSPTGAAASVYTEAELPENLYGDVQCGKQYGTLSYLLNGTRLYTVPLVADRDVQKSNLLGQAAGFVAQKILKYAKEWMPKTETSEPVTTALLTQR